MANNIIQKTQGAVDSGQASKQKWSTWVTTIGQTLVNRTFTDPKEGGKFIANLSSVISNNPDLAKCTNESIFSVALQAWAYKLSLFPALGQVYGVPFDVKQYNPTTRQRETVETKATFIMGYKGYIQLAMRSGQYKRITAEPVYKSEFVRWKKNTEELILNDDIVVHPNDEVAGYFATFETLNGFVKCLYVPYEQMLEYADKYSAAFHKEDYKKFVNGEVDQKDMWKFSSNWYSNFDQMAKKTMIRQLISVWGPMSIDMQEAYIKDTQSMKETGEYDEENTINLKSDDYTAKVVAESKIPDETPKTSTTPKTTPNTPKAADLNTYSPEEVENLWDTLPEDKD